MFIIFVLLFRLFLILLTDVAGGYMTNAYGYVVFVVVVLEYFVY
jgi:hypothetical protein